MDAVIGQLNTSVLVESERIPLTSTLSSVALVLGMHDAAEERDSREMPPEEEESSQGALVKWLKAELEFTGSCRGKLSCPGVCGY
jgi:hypothetical protein